jgi:hypothetical protein
MRDEAFAKMKQDKERRENDIAISETDRKIHVSLFFIIICRKER